MRIPPSDQLIERLKANDRAAMKQVFHTHYEPVCTSVFRILKDRATVEDVAQDVFIKLWEKRHKLLITTSLRAYLNRMAINEAISFLRKHKKHQHQEINALVGGVESVTEEKLLENELASAIQKAMEYLPPRCQMIFKLSRYEELSYKEIAQKMDISVKTVENQMGKALKLMREQLKSYLRS